MPHFAVFLHPTRPNFIETITPEEEETVGRHFHYLKALCDTGKVILAGPALSNPPTGLAILESEDQAEAERILAEDPCIQAGVFTGELHPFRLSMLRK